MEKNTMQWSSAHPGLMIILLDQSGSMQEPYENSRKSEYSSRVVNRVIDTIIQKNFDGESPKNRCFICVIGYETGVEELASGFLSDLDNNPKRIEKLKKKQPDGAGGLIEIDIEQPVWIEPKEAGVTNMKGAFELAQKICSDWMSDHTDKMDPAPVIINISDGMPYYDGKDPLQCMSEVATLCNEIKNTENEDGNILIFNAMIDQEGAKNIFPNSTAGLQDVSEEFLYNISSIIPKSYYSAAEKNGLPIEDGSRGCIFKADGVQLIQLIDFGSSKGLGDIKK